MSRFVYVTSRASAPRLFVALLLLVAAGCRRGKGSLGETPLLEGHTERVNAVAFAPRGDLVASGSSDATVRLWSARGPARVLAADGKVVTLVFSPDGTRLAAGTTTHSIQLWDVSSGRLDRTLVGHEGWVSTLHFTVDGTALISGSYDGTIRRWSMASPASPEWIFRTDWPVGAAEWLDSGWIAVVPSRYRVARSKEGVLLLQAEGAHRWTRVVEGGRPVGVLAVSEKEEEIVSILHDGTIRAWDSKPRPGVGKQVLEGVKATSLAFSPTGVLASGGDDGVVRLWHSTPDGFTERLVLPGHSQPVTDLAFSPDGRLLASASQDRTARIWNVAAVESPPARAVTAASTARTPLPQQVEPTPAKTLVALARIDLGALEDLKPATTAEQKPPERLVSIVETELLFGCRGAPAKWTIVSGSEHVESPPAHGCLAEAEVPPDCAACEQYACEAGIEEMSAEEIAAYERDVAQFRAEEARGFAAAAEARVKRLEDLAEAYPTPHRLRILVENRSGKAVPASTRVLVSALLESNRDCPCGWSFPTPPAELPFPALPADGRAELWLEVPNYAGAFYGIGSTVPDLKAFQREQNGWTQERWNKGSDEQPPVPGAFEATTSAVLECCCCYRT